MKSELPPVEGLNTWIRERAKDRTVITNLILTIIKLDLIHWDRPMSAMAYAKLLTDKYHGY